MFSEGIMEERHKRAGGFVRNREKGEDRVSMSFPRIHSYLDWKETKQNKNKNKPPPEKQDNNKKTKQKIQFEGDSAQLNQGIELQESN